MEQQTSILHSTFDQVEIEVSDILLNLTNIIQESESCSQQNSSSTRWGSKKKRCDRTLELYERVNYVPSCSSPNNYVEINSQLVQESENIEPTSIKVTTSPDTPLSFNPSDIDGESKYSYKKISKRKTKEELIETIEKLTQCRDLLTREVENVRSYHDKQKAYNLKLKAMKERVMTMLNSQGPDNISQHFGISILQPNYQQPLIMDQSCLGPESYHMFQCPMGQLLQAQPVISSTNGLGSVNHTGPQQIPDLNAPLEEVFSMDSIYPFDHGPHIAERKAQCAEARRNRMMKRKETKR